MRSMCQLPKGQARLFESTEIFEYLIKCIGNSLFGIESKQILVQAECKQNRFMHTPHGISCDISRY